MRLSQLVNLPIEKTPRTIGKRIWLVDFPIKTYGLINERKNVLTYNFYAILFAILTGQPQTVVGYIDGNTGEFNCKGGSTRILAFYTTAKSPSFSKLIYGAPDGYISKENVLLSFTEQSDRLVLSMSGVAPKDAQSFVSVFGVGTTSGIIVTAIAGKDILISAEQTVTWRLNLFEPILKNTGYILYGIASYSNPTGVLDISGTSHDVRTSNDTLVFATGTVKVQFGTSNTPFSFDNYMITDPIETTPSITKYVASDYKYIFLILTCYITPTSDTDIYEIGLVRTLYDSAGNTYDALLARMVLSTPITLYGNKTNVVLIRLLAKE